MEQGSLGGWKVVKADLIHAERIKNKQGQHRETSKHAPRAELVGVDGDSVTPSSCAYNRPSFLFLFAFLSINHRISSPIRLHIFRMQRKVDFAFMLCCCVCD